MIVMPSDKSEHRVRVKVRCRSGHDHDLCVEVHRAVHPNMRCEPQQSRGYSYGGGGGCVLPRDLDKLVDWELSSNFQESRRRGYVLIAA